jgi:hypothetical protein
MNSLRREIISGGILVGWILGPPIIALIITPSILERYGQDNEYILAGLMLFGASGIISIILTGLLYPWGKSKVPSKT